MSSGRRISKNIRENEVYLKRRLGINESFDLGYREIIVLDTSVQMYYVNGLSDSNLIQQILKVLVQTNNIENRRAKVNEVITNRMVHQQFERVKTMDEAIDQLLSGLIVIFIDGQAEGYVIDVRQYPGRSPDEPDTERVVRGSRDGYTENIMENAGLTRRRIRDERLRLEIMNVGERSKTDICIGYLQDVADDDLIKLVKEKLSEIDIDGIPMADKTIEEFISDKKWNAFPHVRYTERPDTGAKHLLEGHILLFIDTSPSVIILPTTFFDHLVHAEEFRQSAAVGTVIRWTRFLGVLASLYLLPLWLLFVLDPSLLPEQLSYIGPDEEGNVPIVVQIILADIGVEFLRMAAIHTPTPLATAMGLIAALMIGEIAINVGLFSAEVILYVAISTVGTYVTPSYELSVANKLMKICLLLATAFFGAAGFVISSTISILYLAHMKALKTPYLWPFIPFNAKAFLDMIIRIPIPYANIRPSIVHPKNKYSQPLNKKR
ncbi:MAG TPA: spore germination protein [Bacillota bacterium]